MKLATKLFASATFATVMISLPAVAAAADMTLLNLSFNDPSTVDVNGQDVYLGEAYFTADVGGTVETFGAFCIDVYHDISVGGLDLPYDRSTLVNDSNALLSGGGNPIGVAKSEAIGALANYGLQASDNITKEAVQALIWEDLGADVTNFGANGDAIQQEITTLKALDLTSSRPAETIYAVDGLAQGFTTGVPEPATWVLALAGFFGLGAVLRRARERRSGLAVCRIGAS